MLTDLDMLIFLPPPFALSREAFLPGGREVVKSKSEANDMCIGGAACTQRRPFRSQSSLSITAAVTLTGRVRSMRVLCALSERADKQDGLPRVIPVLTGMLLNQETGLFHQTQPSLAREQTHDVPVLLYA